MFAYSADLQISTFKDIDTTVPRGADIRYQVDFENAEQTVATNVKLIFPLPNSTTFVSVNDVTACSYTLTTREVICNWATIDGTSITDKRKSLLLTIKTSAQTGNIVDSQVRIEASNEDAGKLLNNSETQNTSIVAGVDVAITNLVSLPTTVYVDENYKYQITIQNNGPDIAKGVEFTHVLPSTARWVNQSVNAQKGWACSGTQTIRCLKDELEPNERQNLEIHARLSGVGSGTVTATSSVKSLTAEIKPENNQRAVNTSVSEHADLTGSIVSYHKDGYESRWLTVSDSFSYRVNVVNNGPNKAVNPAFTIRLPAGVTDIAAVQIPNWNCSAFNNQNEMRCSSTSELASNASVPFTISATTPSIAAAYQSTLSVESSTIDRNTNNNTITHTFTAQQGNQTNLVSFSKTLEGRATQFKIGDEITFNLSAINNGDEVQITRISDDLPTGLDFVSAVSSDFNCTFKSPTVTCLPVNGSFKKDQEVKITLKTKAKQAGPYTNTATLTLDTGSPISNSASFTILSSEADVRITKTSDLAWNNKNEMGKVFNFIISVSNVGLGAANNVVISDTLINGYTIAGPVTVNRGSASASDWSCTVSGNTQVVCESASMASRDAISVIIPAKTPFSEAMPRNTASVTYDGLTNANSFTYEGWGFQPSNPVRLSLTKVKKSRLTDNTQLVTQNAEILNEFTVANNGERAAGGTIRVDDVLPQGEQFIANNQYGTDWQCSLSEALSDGTGGKVSCLYTPNPVEGLSGVAPLLVITTRAVGLGGLTNNATLIDEGGFPGIARASATINSVLSADLKVTKAAQLSADQRLITYTIKAEHLSGSTIIGDGANTLVITDTFAGTFIARKGVIATTIDFPTTITSNRNSQFTCSRSDSGLYEQTVSTIKCVLASGEIFQVGDFVELDITASRPFTTVNNQLTNRVNVSSSSFADTDPSNNQSAVTTTLQPRFDVAVNAVTYAANPVLTGDESLLTIEIHNPASSEANGVVLEHQFKPNISRKIQFLSSNFSRLGQRNVCVFNDVTLQLRCEIGVLASNEVQTVTLRFIPKSDISGQDWRLPSISTIYADNMAQDLNSSNNTQTAELLVEARDANLKIENNDVLDPIAWVPSPRDFPVSLDNVVVYKVDLEYLFDNKGDLSVASGVRYDFNMTPSGANRRIQFLCDSSNDKSCTAQTARCDSINAVITQKYTIKCDGPENENNNLEPLELKENPNGSTENIYTRYLFFKVLSRPSTAGEVSATNAVIYSNERDPVLGNNEEREQTSIRVAVDLALTKTASQASVALGSEFDFYIDVFNAGPGDSAENVIYDFLPTEVEVNGTPTVENGLCLVDNAVKSGESVSKQRVICLVDEIALGDSVRVTIPVKVVEIPTSKLITNHAWVETKGFDIDKTNNEDTETVRAVDSALSGKVFFDLNNDGVQQAATDAGLSGITIALSGVRSDNSIIGTQTVKTTASGEFTFIDLEPGVYQLSQVDQSELINFKDGKDSRAGVLIVNSEQSDIIAGITISGQGNSDNHLFAEIGSSEVAGLVWSDLNDNGVQEVTEVVGLEGVEFELVGTDEAGLDVSLNTLSNKQGLYSFNGLRAGIYTLRQPVQPVDFSDGLESEDGAVLENSRTTDMITLGRLNNNQRFLQRNFAEVPTLLSAIIQGMVYLDIEQNGVIDTNDKLLKNVAINLTGKDARGASVSLTTTTDAQGNYRFENVLTSDVTGYTLTQVHPALYKDGVERNSDGAIKDSDTTDEISKIIITDSTTKTYDFTEQNPDTASVSGRVYFDANQDGTITDNDKLLANVDITLIGKDIFGTDINLTTQTNAQGEYTFADLFASDANGYNVTQTQPALYKDGVERNSAGMIADSDVTDTVTVALSTNNQLVDFTEQNPDTATISGRVYFDENQDGTLADNDTLLANVDITLTGKNIFGTDINLTTQTNEQGEYVFADLFASDASGYNVTQTQPAFYKDGVERNSSGAIAGSETTDSVTVQLVANNNELVDFTEQNPDTATISGRVYFDANQDGTIADNDKLLANVDITLIGKDIFGTDINLTTQTNAQGEYTFADLFASDTNGYTVTQTQPALYKDGVERNSSGAIAGSDLTDTVIVNLTASNQLVDFTEQNPDTATISGRVYFDENQDGTLADNDTLLANVDITLTGKNIFGTDINLTTQTNEQGEYVFADLFASDASGYNVTQTQPAFYKDGVERNSSGAIAGSETTDSVTVQLVANNNELVDFTEQNPDTATISGRVYFDENQDGTIADNDTLLTNVDITLTGKDIFGSDINFTAQTNAQGEYTFADLFASDANGYTVTQTQPALYKDGVERNNAGMIAGSDVTDTVTVALSTSNQLVDFTEQNPDTASVSGRVYFDENQDGTLAGNDKLLTGVAITLIGKDIFGTDINFTAQTNEQGEYTFADLFASDTNGYTVTQTQPALYKDGVERNSSGAIAGSDLTDTVTVVLSTSNQLVDFTEQNPDTATISGRVYFDANQDGTIADNDKLLAGVAITLIGKDIFGTDINLTTQTSAQGEYTFADLFASDANGYTVTQTQPALYKDGVERNNTGMIAGSDLTDTVTVALSTNNQLVDFTEQNPDTTTISGRVYFDENQDGTIADNDTLLTNVDITLTGKDIFGSDINFTAQTNAQGEYTFADLFASDANGYTVAQTQPALYKDGVERNSAGMIAGSDVTDTVTVALSTNNQLVDFTEQNPDTATISGRVYFDANQDGTIADNDKLLADVGITLTGKDIFGTDINLTTQTNEQGEYVFADLFASDASGYNVTQTQPALYKDGVERNNTGMIAGSDLTDTVTVALSTSNQLVDFTEQNPDTATISGRVYFDTNQDGTIADNDKLLADVGITLTGKNIFGSDINLTTQTNAQGEYTFADLFASDTNGYIVTQTQPAFYKDGVERNSSGVIAGSDLTDTVIVNLTASNQLVDFTEQNPDTATISGRVYFDENQDGTIADNDTLLTNVDITLTGKDIFGSDINFTAQTNAQGEYTFADLFASDANGYTVTQTQPALYKDGVERNSSGVIAGSDLTDTVIVNLTASNQLVDFTEQNPDTATISGRVYFDENQDGTIAGNDTLLANVDITLTGKNIFGSRISLTTQTNAQGEYTFANLFASNASGYTITQTQPALYKDGVERNSSGVIAGSDLTDTVTVVLTTSNELVDFTEQNPDTASVSGRVYFDENQDGTITGNDTLLANVDITLTGKDIFGSTISLTTQTNEQGEYTFADLFASDANGYTVTQTQPALYKDGVERNNAGVIAGSDVTDTVIVNLTASNELVDFTEQNPDTATISGRVYFDENQDGVIADNDLLLANVDIALTGKDIFGTDINLTAQTNAQGEYTFENLFASDTNGYTVTQTQPALYKDGVERNSSGAIEGSDVTDTVTVMLSASNQLVDFTEQNPNTASVFGRVYFDENQDGTIADNDTLLANVDITLTGKNIFGTDINLTTQTNAQGEYTFENLFASDANGYTVAQTQPALYKDGVERNNVGVIAGSDVTDTVTVMLSASNQLVDFTEQNPD
ncbi:SdrD B-like domain-containing protein, partial [Pseudoalteromonas neustonica]|uniref:SdrD B-like domain-containing protein n=1 Tax=Pseudoalteromonas neustonica TaxID=1840331 RepID=UPI0012FDA248